MDISAQDTFTPAVFVQGDDEFDFSLSGTFVATVVFQRSKDGTNWSDVESFTAPAERRGRRSSGWYIRAGVKTGAYTSGTATVEIYA